MDFDFSERSSAEYIKPVKVSVLLTQCCKITKKKSVGFRHFSGGSALQVWAGDSLRGLTLTHLNERLQLVPKRDSVYRVRESDAFSLFLARDYHKLLFHSVFLAPLSETPNVGPEATRCVCSKKRFAGNETRQFNFKRGAVSASLARLSTSFALTLIHIHVSHFFARASCEVTGDQQHVTPRAAANHSDCECSLKDGAGGKKINKINK